MTQKIFISHAFADLRVAELLHSTLIRGGVPNDRIFYSSARSTGIPAGVDIRAHLRSELQEAGLVIELISTTFLSRAMCIMELGAAWALDKPTFPIVIPPLTREVAVKDIGNVLMGVLASGQDIQDVFADLPGRISSHIGLPINFAQWQEGIKMFVTGLPVALSAAASTNVSPPEDVRVTTTPPTVGTVKWGPLTLSNFTVSQTSYNTEVVGEVSSSEASYRTVWLVATFYSEDGSILSTAMGNVSQLSAGDTKTFRLTSRDIVPPYARMKVQVESTH